MLGSFKNFYRSVGFTNQLLMTRSFGNYTVNRLQ